MQDLLCDWRSACDWRSLTGLGDDGKPAGGRLMKEAENQGDPDDIKAAETSVKSKPFQLMQCFTVVLITW